jgi:hypothetical protein
MTLIARGVFDGYPIFIADLLLSTEAKSREIVDLPVFDDINSLLPETADRSVVGLHQKLLLLNERLTVAWAGNFEYAKQICLRLSKEISITPLRLNYLLSKVPLWKRNEVALLGAISVPSKIRPDLVSVEYFHTPNVDIAKSETLRDCYVAGSGAARFIEWTDQMKYVTWKGAATLGSREKSDFLAVSAAAVFTGNEAATGGNILEWFGGGFEVVTFRSGHLTKIGNILHTFWQARPIPGGYSFLPIPKVLKADYIEDVLVLQTFEYDMSQEGEKMMARKRNHVYRTYPPLLSKKRDFRLVRGELPSLDHEWLCCYITVYDNAGRTQVLGRTYGGDTPFRMTISPDGLMLSFHRDFIPDIHAEIRSKLDDNGLFV